MKFFKRIILILFISSLFAINVNAEEEKSYIYQRNEFLCAGNPDPVTIEGCYFTANSEGSEKAFGDFYSNEYHGAGEAHSEISYTLTGATKYSHPYYVKSAKFMQAYTVFNNEEKAVLGLCYMGYIGKVKVDTGCGGETQPNIVKEKDSDHPYPVVYLKVVYPRGNKCISYKHQLVYEEDTWNNIPHGSTDMGRGYAKPRTYIDTTDYEGYKTGSCPKYFNFTSNLKGLAKWYNSDKEFTFSDNPAVEYKRGFIDSFIGTDFSGRITGCTQKDVEAEDFKTDCYDKKLELIEKYTCPANIKDFDLDLGNYAEECNPLKQIDKSAYSRTYLESLAKEYGDKIKNAYAEKIEECSERNCGLTDAERSSVKAKMKGNVCEFGCKLAVYETGSSATEGKCIACGSSQGLTYQWRNKDYQPIGNCAEVQLSYDKCLGDTKTQACSECYTNAYAGLPDDKKTCLLNILSEKAEKIQAYKEKVDEAEQKEVEDGVTEYLTVAELAWNASNAIFIIPGLSSGGFGQIGQSCYDLAQSNVINIVKGAVNVFRIGAVIIAIVNAMIMLVPAVIAKDADGLNKAGRKLVIMAAVLAIIGVLPTIIYIIGRMFGYDLSCLF